MSDVAMPVGRWRVERTGGLLPLVGVTKQIGPDGGWTYLLGVPLGRFDVRDGRRLVYRGWPVVDELERAPDGSWHGRGLALGRIELVRFRLVPPGSGG
ncbi:MAG: hypothetical protein R3C15_04380 [Thermoleophilia bacterium]